MAWIGLHRHTETELHSPAAEFNHHELAVEDALDAHQRPKLERYGGLPRRPRGLPPHLRTPSTS
ncbi:hypothetical protein [Streptomyces sp. NPDC059949]|uniref:hypothetical protein n=1 Tax=Streptomyces sp. NPDC059949 TaxID=3347013 RepID=UPI0036478E7A